MLKLIKYELIRSYRNYFMLFVVYLAVCVVVPFVANIDLLSDLFFLVFIVLVVGLSFSIFISIVMDFWKSMFSREGYLTLTLPLSTAEVLLAKLIAAFIWVVVASFVLLLGVFILCMLLLHVMGEGVSLSEVFEAFGIVIKYIDGETLLTIVLTIVALVVSGFQSIIYLYTCMSAVHTKLVRNARPLFAIILYFLGSLALSWILGLLGLNIDYTVSTLSEFNSLYIMQILISGLLAVAFFFTTAYIIDNHIELDA